MVPIPVLYLGYSWDKENNDEVETNNSPNGKMGLKQEISIYISVYL